VWKNEGRGIEQGKRMMEGELTGYAKMWGGFSEFQFVYPNLSYMS